MLMLDEKARLAIPKVRAWFWASPALHPRWSEGNRRGSSPNCGYTFGSVELSKLSGWGDARPQPFTGDERPRTNPDNEPQNFIRPPANFRVADKVLPASIEARLDHRAVEQRSVIGRSSER